MLAIYSLSHGIMRMLEEVIHKSVHSHKCCVNMVLILNSTFLQFPITSSLFRPNILLSTLFSNTLSLHSSLNVRDQVSHPYRTTDKIIVEIYITTIRIYFQLFTVHHAIISRLKSKPFKIHHCTTCFGILDNHQVHWNSGKPPCLPHCAHTLYIQLLLQCFCKI
jgi:hypothetical protein